MVSGYEEYPTVTVDHAQHWNSKWKERQTENVHSIRQSLRAPVWTAGGGLGIIHDLAPANLRCKSPENGMDPAHQ